MVWGPADQRVSVLCWANPRDAAAKGLRDTGANVLGWGRVSTLHPVCTEKLHLTNRPEPSANKRTSSYLVHFALQDTSSTVCCKRTLNNPEIAGEPLCFCNWREDENQGKGIDAHLLQGRVGIRIYFHRTWDKQMSKSSD